MPAWLSPASVHSSASAHGAISDSSAETVVVVTSANCCFSDSALRHHLAAVAAPRSLFRS